MTGRGTKCIGVVLAVVSMLSFVAMAEPNSGTSPAAMMRELRLRWLSESWRESLKDHETEQRVSDKVLAVLMDWPIRDDRIATVLAASSGDASLYTTGSFGIIGGIGHDNVRQAAVALTDGAGRYLALATPTTDYSYPDKGSIRFFFVLPSGVQSITFPLTEVEQPGSPARDLFAHAQQVLTELRSIAPPPGGQQR